jgi:hypothetical protein
MDVRPLVINSLEEITTTGHHQAMTPETHRFLLAMVLKPFVALVFFSLVAAIVYPIRKHMPDGKLKRFLFKKIS